MKRERAVDENEANCTGSYNNRVFECKTCTRKFHSFQALGGHRASHKKPRLMAGVADMDGKLLHGSPQKHKTHECSICGLEFPIGQALGGHMRRHIAANLNGNMIGSSGSGISNLDFSPNMMKAGNKRVLHFDLNLTPFENHMEFLKMERQLLWLIYYL